MNNHIIFFAILTITLQSVFGQQNRTKNWVVGDNISIDFNNSTPTVGLSGLQSFEGYSIISDTTGALLFYTNGISVWTKNHQQMSNGYGLNSHLSATNSSLIVPMPNNQNIYYIFTVGAYGGNQGGFGGVAYSIVDMSLNNGFGEVVQKNTVLHSKSTEKLCATMHENGSDYWIMSHDFGNNQFRAFLLTENGVEVNQIISKTGAVHFEYPVGDWGSRTVGSMRFSPSGCFLGLVLAGSQNDTIQLFKFDNSSGYVFDPINLRAIGGSGYYPYAICFSPDNSKLYVSVHDWLYQFNLSSNNQTIIQLSKTLIATNSLFLTGTPKYDYSDLQIAPNGKIYISRMLTDYLSCLHFPNAPGSSSFYEDTSIVFPNFHCEYGLPNFVSNFLIQDSLPIETCQKFCPPLELGEDVTICEGDTLLLDLDLPNGTILWSDSSDNFRFSFYEEGSYIAVFDFNHCATQIDTINVDIIHNSLPTIADTVLCILTPLQYTLPSDSNGLYLLNNVNIENEFFLSSNGTYFLELHKDNCIFQDKFIIQNNCTPILTMPNVFSPNGDGMNDIFSPLEKENIKEYKVTVYNRWGNIVYFGNENSVFWDGYQNGKKCSDGVYYYIINYQDMLNKTMFKSGTISLVD